MLQNIQLFIPPNVIFDININTAQMNFLLLYLGFLKKNLLNEKDIYPYLH